MSLLPLLAHVIILLAGVNESLQQQQIWISKVDPIDDESLKVQAIVVKDEEVTASAVHGCKANTATRNNNNNDNDDVRYSTKRYLMCVGSILTSRYILTSASCIHEATHIRHNIRAPLAIMIAPFSDTAQVIKIAGYSIHPKHLVDPRDEHYVLHNVAIVKLVCRISKYNLHEIKLPTQPFIDQCAEDDCKVTITKEIGPMSFLMYEVSADNIGVMRRKRELLVVSKRNNPKKTVNETRFNNHDIKKVLESNENGSSDDDSRIIETMGRKASNENSKNIESNFKSKKTIRYKKLVTRESHGIKGCPQTGSAVMSNKIQTAMVTVSCDDRQSETPWQYTDLFDNLDWINEMIGNWKPTNPTLTAGCNTCIYNFFIDNNNCKNRKCQKNDVNIPVQLLPKCTENHTDSEIPFIHNHPKNNDSQLFMNRAYIDAINNLYLNKHNHTDENDNDNEFKPDSAMNKNSYRSVDETVKLRLFSQSSNNSVKQHDQQQQQQGNSAAEKTLVLDYKDNQADLESNYRKVKATYDNDYKPREYTPDGNEYQERENRDYQPRYNQIKKPNVAMSDDSRTVESLRGLFANGRFDENSLPKEWIELYKKFLEEYEQSKEKVNKNVVRRAQ